MRPRALSGGQAQRVALVRALATAPDVLLLDEPLAALDASTTLHVRAELGQHLSRYYGRTLLVTHDPLDAMVLADRLVIVENGRVVQEGVPTEIARRPRTDYVAQLVGLNLYRGRADGTTVALDGGGTLTVASPTTGNVYVAFPPSAISLYPEPPIGTPRNTWPMQVAGFEQHAHTVRVRLTPHNSMRPRDATGRHHHGSSGRPPPDTRPTAARDVESNRDPDLSGLDLRRHRCWRSRTGAHRSGRS